MTNDQRPTTNDPIHVALAVYDPSGIYSQHAGVTITSIFENTKSKVIVHILHDETLTEENRRRFIRTAEKYNQTIEFVDVTEYAKQFSDKIVRLARHFTIGSLYKFFIPTLLSSLKKVIYLDCDVLVNLDISELWIMDVEANSIAGVRDYGTYHMFPEKSYYGVYAKLICGDAKSYINSGVMLMNLAKIRNYGNFCELSVEWLIQHTHLSLFADQDAINSLFRNDIKFLDERFNMTAPTGDISNCIIHMYKLSKPWKEFTNAPHHILYWDMYLRSAWGENITPHELIEKLSIIAGTMKDNLMHSNYMHKSFRQCLRRVIAGIWHKITFRKKRRIIKLILSDIIHRLKYKFSR